MFASNFSTRKDEQTERMRSHLATGGITSRNLIRVGRKSEVLFNLRGGDLSGAVVTIVDFHFHAPPFSTVYITDWQIRNGKIVHEGRLDIRSLTPSVESYHHEMRMWLEYKQLQREIARQGNNRLAGFLMKRRYGKNRKPSTVNYIVTYNSGF